MVSGLHFVESLLVGVGTSLALLAAFLVAVEFTPGPGVAAGRHWLAQRWLTVSQLPWPALPTLALRWSGTLFDSTVQLVIVGWDRTNYFLPTVTTISLIVLPLLALINYLGGGSPTILLSYAAVLGGCVVLIVIGEWRALALLRGAVSFMVAAAVLVVLPSYALVSLTTHAMGSGFTNSVLNSTVLIVFCYVPAAGFWTLFRSGAEFAAMRPWERFLARALMSQPIYYFLYFLALLAGQLAVFDWSPARSWPALAATMAMGGSAVAASLAILDKTVDRDGRTHPCAGLAAILCIAAVLSLINALLIGVRDPLALLIGHNPSGAMSLGPTFWVTHLTFLPLIGLLAAVFSLALAKAVAKLGSRSIASKPYLSAALSAGLAAALAFAAAGVAGGVNS